MQQKILAFVAYMVGPTYENIRDVPRTSGRGFLESPIPNLDLTELPGKCGLRAPVNHALTPIIMIYTHWFKRLFIRAYGNCTSASRYDKKSPQIVGLKAADVLDKFLAGKHNANTLNILVYLHSQRLPIQDAAPSTIFWP